MDIADGDRPPTQPSDPPLARETDPPHGGSTGDAVSRAAHGAIRRAKRRRDAEVTPDDLLIALLGEISRFGIARIGQWAIDVVALAGDGAGPEEPEEGVHPGDVAPAGGIRPRYAAATVALFERASAIARRDGSPITRVVHLLVAFTDEEGLMAALRGAHGFTGAEWRAALAELDPSLDGGPTVRADGRSSARIPELLSVDDAAEFLGVHAQTVRNYIRSGKLPAYRLAGERFIRVLRRDLLALLERVQVEDASAAPMPG